MIIGSSYHTVKVNELPNTSISNVKIVGPFWWNTDGIQLGDSPGSTIDNSFIYTQDDSLCLYRGATATNNVVANTQNGSAVWVDGWATNPSNDVVVDGLYIMHGQHTNTQSAIEVLQYNQEPLNNIVFKNIYAENINSGAFMRIMHDKRWVDSSIIVGYAPGKMRDIYFENVYLHDNYGGSITGFDADRNISNIYFNNFNIWNGSSWSVKTSLSQIGMTANANVSNVYFNTPAVFIKGNENAYIVSGTNKTVTIDTRYIGGVGKTLQYIELWADGVFYASVPATTGVISYPFTLSNLTAGSHIIYAKAGTTDGTWYQSRDYRLEAKAANQLLFNKDFEYGKSGLADANGDRDWYKTKGSSVVATTVKSGIHSGSKALKVTGRNGTKDGLYQSISGQLHDWYTTKNPASGTYPVTFSVWVKNESVTSNMRFAIRYYDWNSVTNDPQSYMYSNYVSVGTGWTQLTYTWNLPSSSIGTFRPTDVVFAIENANATANYFIDDASVTVPA